MKAKNIGIDVKVPEKECEDPLCAFHGNVKLRGRTFIGTIISDKMNKTVIVQWDRTEFVPKYERYIKKRSKVKAHNPKCIDAKNGDIVKIVETRPLSKTKNFAVIEIVGKQKQIESEEAIEEEKAKSRKIKSKIKKEEAAKAEEKAK